MAASQKPGTDQLILTRNDTEMRKDKGQGGETHEL